MIFEPSRPHVSGAWFCVGGERPYSPFFIKAGRERVTLRTAPQEMQE